MNVFGIHLLVKEREKRKQWIFIYDLMFTLVSYEVKNQFIYCFFVLVSIFPLITIYLTACTNTRLVYLISRPSRRMLDVSVRLISRPRQWVFSFMSPSALTVFVQGAARLTGGGGA